MTGYHAACVAKPGGKEVTAVWSPLPTPAVSAFFMHFTAAISPTYTHTPHVGSNLNVAPKNHWGGGGKGCFVALAHPELIFSYVIFSFCPDEALSRS